MHYAYGIAVSLAAGLVACAHTTSEADAGTARIHHDIAIASFHRGDLRGALRELLVAVDLDPELAQAHNALGLVYHAMGRTDDALRHYRRALELKPDYSEAHNNLGVLWMDLGRYEQAIASLEAALGDILYATPSLAEGNLGWAHYKNGDIERGRRHLRNAVAQNPKFCRGYEWLARIGIERGEPAEIVANVKRFEKYCLQDAEVARTLTPDYVRQMKYYLGVGYLKQGERDAARVAFAACAAASADSGFGLKCAQSLRSLE